MNPLEEVRYSIYNRDLYDVIRLLIVHHKRPEIRAYIMKHVSPWFPEGYLEHFDIWITGETMAPRYQYEIVITPLDILMQNPELYPFVEEQFSDVRLFSGSYAETVEDRDYLTFFYEKKNDKGEVTVHLEKLEKEYLAVVRVDYKSKYVTREGIEMWYDDVMTFGGYLDRTTNRIFFMEKCINNEDETLETKDHIHMLEGYSFVESFIAFKHEPDFE